MHASSAPLARQAVFIAFLFFLAALVANAHAELIPGDHPGRTLNSGGLTRRYDLHVPPSYTGTSAVPLVLDLHGLNSDQSTQAALSGLKKLSDVNGYIIAYPEGFEASTMRSWNAGICCDPAKSAGIDDVAFLKAVVADISAQGNVDSTRVYATGFSNGGGMAHRLGCEASGTFAAVAAVAMPLFLDPFSQCAPSRPIPVLHFAGLTDTVVPYDSGQSQVLPGLAVPPSPASFAYWASVDGCTGAPEVEHLPNGSSCQTQNNCAGQVKVSLCSIHGTGGVGHVLYVNDEGLNVAQRIWSFFSQFPPPLAPAESSSSAAASSLKTAMSARATVAH
jgi:poly(3-hydroxybutyrate) depolymerase